MPTNFAYIYKPRRRNNGGCSVRALRLVGKTSQSVFLEWENWQRFKIKLLRGFDASGRPVDLSDGSFEILLYAT